MIIVNIACGLANRMFQYSYYLYLKKWDMMQRLTFTRQPNWSMKM